MRKTKGLCSVEGCGKKHSAKGFCSKHYQRAKVQGIVGNQNKCTVDGCKKKMASLGLCGFHYLRFRRNKPLKGRTIYTPNDFIVDGDICRIGLYNKDGERIAETIIDAEDMDRCVGMKWTLGKNGYVSYEKKRLFLHRHLIGTTGNLHTDHINRNQLDNRKENLRVCPAHKNLWNSKLRSDNTSGHKGVYWVKRLNKWCAIHRDGNGKDRFLGNFKQKEDAINTYQAVAKTERGEFYFDGHNVGDN